MVEKTQEKREKVKYLHERIEKLEKMKLEDKIEELKNELETIKNSLNRAIILIPAIEDDEENKKFVEEQIYIDELTEKFEGEILAFTRKESKLYLVAHSFFRNDLMDLIGNAYKSDEIGKDSEIFYR